MNKKEYLKAVLLGLLAIVIYFGINNYAAFPFTFLGIDTENLSSTFKYFYTLFLTISIF